VSSIRVIAHPSDEIMVTREIDVFFAFCWSALAVWGLAAGIKGLPSVTEAVGQNYNFFWALGIGVASVGALWSNVAIFFKTRFGQVTKKRFERAFCWAMLFFVAYYPIALFLAGSWPSAVLVLIFLGLAVYRIRHLTYRIKLYHDSAASI
jgi:hypothetical protein